MKRKNLVFTCLILQPWIHGCTHDFFTKGARVESEVKVTLTQKAYETLYKEALAAHAKINLQRNVYFEDPSGVLAEQKISLRVRLIDNHQAILGIKLANVSLNTQDDALFAREEHECQFTDVYEGEQLAVGTKKLTQINMTDCKAVKNSQHPLAIIKNILPKQEAQEALKPAVSNATKRLTFQKTIDGDTFKFELDRTRFLERYESFELEVELTEKQKSETVLNFLRKEVASGFSPSSLSKAEITFAIRDKKGDSLISQGMIHRL
jgi:inorganic triphosphatase YgiF